MNMFSSVWLMLNNILQDILQCVCTNQVLSFVYRYKFLKGTGSLSNDKAEWQSHGLYLNCSERYNRYIHSRSLRDLF